MSDEREAVSRGAGNLSHPISSYEEFYESEKEFRKIVGQDARHADDTEFDLYKHLTTLSAGTIVVLAAFLRTPTVSASNVGRTLLALSGVAMIFSVICGYIGMIAVVRIQRTSVKMAHHALHIADEVKKNEVKPTPAECSDEPNTSLVESVMGLLKAGAHLRIAGCMQPIFAIIGFFAFVSGLGLLAVFVWMNAG